MRRGFGIWMVVLVLLVVAAGIGAYNWGFSQGLEESGRAVEVVRYHGPGFFPFGLLLFPLLFLAIFALARGAFWGRGHWGGPGHHGGPWKLEEYHRQLHEREASGGSGSSEAGSA